MTIDSYQALSYKELETIDNARTSVIIVRDAFLIPSDLSVHSRKRTAIFAVVGLMYVITGLIEVFGIVSTAMVRLT